MTLKQIEGAPRKGLAEYIWMDYPEGGDVWALRSKTRTVEFYGAEQPTLTPWSFEGWISGVANCTLQLTPAKYAPDPIRGEGCFLVLCEVRDVRGKPVDKNHRAKLRELIDGGYEDAVPQWKFTQQVYLHRPYHWWHTKSEGARPLMAGWPDSGEAHSQGKYYCGVGAKYVGGRKLMEDFVRACMQAGIEVTSISPGPSLGQWSYTVESSSGVAQPTLHAADDLWLSRWVLQRLGEEHNLVPVWHPNPLGEGWRPSHLYVSVSTDAMRNGAAGPHAVTQTISRLEEAHDDCAEPYALKDLQPLGDRHPGLFKDYHWFERQDQRDVRVPLETARTKSGPVEDRRPNSDACPYRVCDYVLSTTQTTPEEPKTSNVRVIYPG